MSGLRDEKCEACTAKTPRVTGDGIAELKRELHADWSVSDDERTLRRSFRFDDFTGAYTLATAIALTAQDEGHHPELSVGWGHLDVELTTHAIKGLSRNDFVLAAKVDALAER